VTARRFLIGFGVFVIAVAVWTIVQPLGLQRFSEQVLTEKGFGVAVVFRLIVGVLLWVTASASRTPRVLKALGALFILSGIALAIIGLDRLQGIADWGAGLDHAILRTVGLVAGAMGAFIIWSVWPRRSGA